MTFETIASGSSGNCYVLRDLGHELLIEAGILYARIQEALRFKVTALTACLVTHCHIDHAKSVNQLMAAGVDCWSSSETWEKLGCDGNHRALVLKERTEHQIGSFKVLPFDVPHDVRTFGFLIEGPSGDKILFVTDAGYVPIKTDGAKILAIEVNFDLEIMKGNNIHGARHNRNYKGHHDISRFERWLDDMLEAGYMRSVEEIVLLHLSSQNANANEFRERIQRRSGKIVRIAGQEKRKPNF